MSTGALVVLVVVAVLLAYVLCGAVTARHASRELYTANIRYVRSRRYSARAHDDPMTDDEMARVFREIRKDQREIVALWPFYAVSTALDWNRSRRKAKLGASGGWMLAGARAADTELADARAALEVWRHEHDTEDGLRAETAARMIETTEQTIKRLEGRR